MYRDADPDVRKSILIAGTGRSGTTWLADVLATVFPCRIMFEPFHRDFIEAYRDFHYFHYARPAESDERLLSYCQTVFSGSIRHPWIDSGVGHLFPKYRVVKEIRANLFLRWIRERFPGLPILFLVRHPCAVVLSRMRSDWATDLDIAPFLAQEKLIEDHLKDRLDLIRGARRVEEKHAIVWCVSNLVPLAQFEPGELDVVFYERLCTQPEPEIRRIIQILNKEPFEAEEAKLGRALRRIDVPSGTTLRSSAVVTGEDPVGRWRKHLSRDQIANILAVVEAFGLGHLYGDSDRPQADC
ncbi:MAG: sulfotransferase [Gemmatimonadota bacterium]